MATGWLEDEKKKRDQAMARVEAEVRQRQNKKQPVVRRKEKLVTACRRAVREFVDETKWKLDERDMSGIIGRRPDRWNSAVEFYVFPEGGGGFFVAVQERIQDWFFAKRTELRVQVRLAPVERRKPVSWDLAENGFSEEKLHKSISLAWRACGWL